MNKNQIVVNTILFADKIAQGARQADFFEELHESGISKVEVRYEYFTNNNEFLETRRLAETYNLELWLSVPETLFEHQQLRTEKLQEVLLYARELGVWSIKWNLGDFGDWTEDDLQQFRKIAENLSCLLTIENDQTSVNGTMAANLRFLKQCREYNIPVFNTFDIGNWLWTGEDPIENARALKNFVRYIHIKDVIVTNKGPKALLLGEGDLPIKSILAELPNDVPIALEFGGGENPFQAIQSGINWLV